MSVNRPYFSLLYGHYNDGYVVHCNWYFDSHSHFLQFGYIHWHGTYYI